MEVLSFKKKILSIAISALIANGAYANTINERPISASVEAVKQPLSVGYNNPFSAFSTRQHKLDSTPSLDKKTHYVF